MTRNAEVYRLVRLAAFFLLVVAFRGGSSNISQVRRKQEVFDHWYIEEWKNAGWWTVLPQCPLALCIQRRGLFDRRVANDARGFEDPGKVGYFEGRFHPPPAFFSMRSTPVNGHSNQCIYDKDGQLSQNPKFDELNNPNLYSLHMLIWEIGISLA